MARITIDLNTDDATDKRVLRAVADAIAGPIAITIPIEEDDEGERPLARHTQDAETAPTRRVRRTKAQIAEDEAKAAGAAAQPATPPAPGSATNGAGHGPDATSGVTLEVVNNRLRELMTMEGDGRKNALQLQELVKEATDGKYGSANKAFAEGGQEMLDAIWAGLEAL